MNDKKILHLGLLTLGGILLSAATFAQDVLPPERIARVSLVQGEVSFAPTGTEAWATAELNRPLIGGDRLYTGDAARTVLEIDAGALRVDERSAIEIIALEEGRAQFGVTEGTVNLVVHRLDPDAVYEIDTPMLAFVAEQAGSYRVDIDPAGNGAMVTVFAGAGSVWDVDNRKRSLASGRSYRFEGAPAQVRESAIPGGNDFDRFCADLDARHASSVSASYVADNVVGYRDLDRYGSWQASTDYGQVWYPTTVPAGWAPFRDGRWAWIEPWGWTWIDSAPWGFAPFHYGRWAWINSRWGWVPGPRSYRAVYAPALVAFIGNVSIGIGGGPVGWFPLGPYDLYQPPYHVTENYFISINLGGGRFFRRTTMQGHWNDYRRGNSAHWNYAYRSRRDAVTSAPREVFRNSRRITRSGQVDDNWLRGRDIARGPDVRPGQRAPSRARTGDHERQREAFDRRVVTRTGTRNPTRNEALTGTPRSGRVTGDTAVPARVPRTAAERTSREWNPEPGLVRSPRGRAPRDANTDEPRAPREQGRERRTPNAGSARSQPDTSLPRVEAVRIAEEPAITPRRTTPADGPIAPVPASRPANRQPVAPEARIEAPSTARSRVQQARDPSPLPRTGSLPEPQQSLSAERSREFTRTAPTRRPAAPPSAPSGNLVPAPAPRSSVRGGAAAPIPSGGISRPAPAPSRPAAPAPAPAAPPVVAPRNSGSSNQPARKGGRALPMQGPSRSAGRSSRNN